jgi:hypothetical protein
VDGDVFGWGLCIANAIKVAVSVPAPEDKKVDWYEGATLFG